MPGMPMPGMPGMPGMPMQPGQQPGQPVSMEDLPFSSTGHKAMWMGIFDMVQKEVDQFLHSRQGQMAASSVPRIPMPNIPDKQLEMIYDSYAEEELRGDLEGAAAGGAMVEEISDEDAARIQAGLPPLGGESSNPKPASVPKLTIPKLKALMRDMECVTCIVMSKQKGEAMAEARQEMAMMMGPQMAQMMSGMVSQAMDFELQMVKAMSAQEVPDEVAADLFRELDANKDGEVSKADFIATAKKALFDPNPPEEVLQAMEAQMAGMPTNPMLVNGPIMSGVPQPVMVGGHGPPMAMGPHHVRSSGATGLRAPTAGPPNNVKGPPLRGPPLAGVKKGPPITSTKSPVPPTPRGSAQASKVPPASSLRTPFPGSAKGIPQAPLKTGAEPQRGSVTGAPKPLQSAVPTPAMAAVFSNRPPRVGMPAPAPAASPLPARGYPHQPGFSYGPSAHMQPPPYMRR
eukprot:gnl/TRDRNA2_/TRDRNA2_84803_c0_seq1.p1 gnl/TRDRNA2_/TRDRNA2_84803_c0~~gnl/TRDRNA2_/TRDRNA2_84803_c0_seq1.p1  ORF type:complete len:471 (-),score=100.06 gnl/TRDRNA2_/TRDRNA2_84803_c0_seq1:130-1503(-)